MQNKGRIINDSLTGKERIEIGQQTLNIRIPDVESNSYTLYQVYNSDFMTHLPVIGLDTVVPDYIDVNDAQYINARVASVSNGTINVDIGRQGAASRATTNSWSMAAKQSELFTASKQGHLNWNSNNRITFTAATPPYSGDRLAYNRGNVVNYSGVFSVTTP
ncbi:hypothetical protein O3W44_23615 [Pantoea sp. LMR881]|uniref:hypothetical protein n=1 Tax=Pantoea sp. LMR881 TaxID=3014336 RepID=UPI0022B04F1C|nr:hypothetical protein [Pantoea sp. LMR881]MCZ4061483.1 hypothetical protein [Pantoea sp. LMR881]